MTNTPVDEARPDLWNPSAAACWSLLFTPAFGSYLHARNAEVLGRTDEARANRLWFHVSLAYLGVLLLSLFFPSIPDEAFSLVSLGLLVSWYFNVAKKQVRYARETLKNEYVRRSWLKPLLCGFGGFLGFGAMGAILSMFMEGP